MQIHGLKMLSGVGRLAKAAVGRSVVHPWRGFLFTTTPDRGESLVSRGD